jgi:hypothetical protein
MIKGLQNLLDYEAARPVISKLDVGEGGWLVPWMFMMTKKEGNIYVQDTEIEPSSGGTLQVF